MKEVICPGCLNIYSYKVTKKNVDSSESNSIAHALKSLTTSHTVRQLAWYSWLRGGNKSQVHMSLMVTLHINELGCYNKILKIGWENNRNLFLIVWSLGIPRSMLW